MKLLKRISLLALLIVVSACMINAPNTPDSAYGAMAIPRNNVRGGVDGGGGKSVVCRDDQNNIISAQSLDLYEGRTMYGLNIPTSDETMELQIDRALKTFPTRQSIIELNVTTVKEKMTLLAAGTQLSEVNDSYDVIFPQGCKAEQLARYYSDEKILVSGDIWKHLSNTDKAALVLHEAIYSLNRNYGALDSRQSRHIVMNLFDANTKWTDPNLNIPEDALLCFSMNGSLFMWAFQNVEKNWVLQFGVVGNTTIVSKKQAILYVNPNEAFNFNEAKKIEITKGDNLIGSSVMMDLTLNSDFEGNDSITLKKVWEPVVLTNGRTMSGYQTLRYYLSWTSRTFPGLSQPDQMLNCGLTTIKNKVQDNF